MEKMEKMRNLIGKRTLVVSLILSVNCVQHSFKFFFHFSWVDDVVYEGDNYHS